MAVEEKKDLGDENKDDSMEEWKTKFVECEPQQFVDSFRHFHPDRTSAFTCWNTKMNCRSTNYGTRIDYIFVCKEISENLVSCDIHPDIEGSDHCPVSAVINLKVIPAEKCPSYCTKNFPEFAGKQQKVSHFFTSNAKRPIADTSADKNLPKKPKVQQQSKLSSFFTVSSKPKEQTQSSKSNVEQNNSELDDDMPNILENIKKQEAKVSAWKALFKGPPEAPCCKGHGEPSVLRTVKKKGPNNGRQFWCCARGEGRADDPKARCDFFKWVK